VLVAAAAVAAVLAAGAGVSAWQAVRATEAEGKTARQLDLTGAAERQARTAEQKARGEEKKARDAEAKARAGEREEKKARQTAEAVAEFMQEVFAQTSAHGQASPTRKVNPKLTVKEAMDYAAKNIEGRFQDQPEIEAAVRNIIGQTYRELGAFTDAEPQWVRALEIREKALGPDHPETLRSVNNLALLYNLERRPDDAEPLLKRALAGYEKTLGPDHPDTLNSVNNLVALHWSRRRYAEAEPLLKRTVAASEKVHGPDHPDTLVSVGNLAALYLAQGRHAEAEPLLKRTVAGREKAHGPEHPDTVTSVNNLAALYWSRGHYAEAEPLLKRALAASEKTLGPDHPDTLVSVNNLGALYFEAKRYREAVPLLRRSAAGRARRPEMAGTLPIVRSYLGLALLGDGKPAEAEPHLLAGSDGLGPQAARLDPTRRNLLRQVTAGLAEVYAQTDQPGRAKQWRAKLAELPPEVAPPPRPVNR
jgi:tetratricopeptide (TPR) repeat protein